MNLEYRTISNMVIEQYSTAKFRKDNDEKAFLVLAMAYLGRNSSGRVDDNLASLSARKQTGDAIFENFYKDDNISAEGKVRIEQLWESYSIIVDKLAENGNYKKLNEKPIIKINRMEDSIIELTELVKEEPEQEKVINPTEFSEENRIPAYKLVRMLNERKKKMKPPRW